MVTEYTVRSGEGSPSRDTHENARLRFNTSAVFGLRKELANPGLFRLHAKPLRN